jgi:hypothetical protein
LLVAIAGACTLLYCGALYKHKKMMNYEKKKKWFAAASVLFAMISTGIIVYAYVLCRNTITLGIGFGIVAVILASLKIYGYNRGLSKKVGYAESVKAD